MNNSVINDAYTSVLLDEDEDIFKISTVVNQP